MKFCAWRCRIASIFVAVVAGTSLGQPVDDAATRAQEARDRVAALEAQLEAAQAQLADAESQLATQMPDIADESVYTPGWLDGWKGSVEAGLNGSDGNTEQISFRIAARAKRTTERMETTVGASYQYATSSGVESENRFEAFGLNEWLNKGSRWRYFATGKYEFDEFQDWDHRLSGFVGVGYEFIKNDKTTLIGRAGLGGAYEIGGQNEEFNPEAMLGLDYTRKLTERQFLTASTEIYPNLSDFNEFRMVNRAGWQITVDPETNMFLRLGAEHRHDSDPGAGFKPNDLDYYLTLGWDF
jgi:putative salt-induced outer membrane protein YdiY